MALTPTEREEHFFKAMVDAADGNTPEELEPTERREHWYKEIIDAIKVGGGAGGGVLVANDVDGTLDKTWQEIVDADFAVVHMEINSEDDPPPRGFVSPVVYHEIDSKSGDYSICVLTYEDGSVLIQYYLASSASGYPHA